MTDPWCWYIYIYMLTFGVNLDGIHVTRYTSTMDPSWDINGGFIEKHRIEEFSSHEAEHGQADWHRNWRRLAFIDWNQKNGERAQSSFCWQMCCRKRQLRYRTNILDIYRYLIPTMIQILTATLIGLNAAEFFFFSKNFSGWLKCRSESALIPYGEMCYMCYASQPYGVPPAWRFFGMFVKLQRFFLCQIL